MYNTCRLLDTNWLFSNSSADRVGRWLSARIKSEQVCDITTGVWSQLWSKYAACTEQDMKARKPQENDFKSGTFQIKIICISIDAGSSAEGGRKWGLMLLCGFVQDIFASCGGKCSQFIYLNTNSEVEKSSCGLFNDQTRFRGLTAGNDISNYLSGVPSTFQSCFPLAQGEWPTVCVKCSSQSEQRVGLGGLRRLENHLCKREDEREGRSGRLFRSPPSKAEATAAAKLKKEKKNNKTIECGSTANCTDRQGFHSVLYWDGQAHKWMHKYTSNLSPRSWLPFKPRRQCVWLVLISSIFHFQKWVDLISAGC